MVICTLWTGLSLENEQRIVPSPSGETCENASPVGRWLPGLRGTPRQ
jgi:hypothetical protein